MAMHLIDRPFLDHAAASHRAGGTALSIALHGTLLLALIVVMRAVPEDAISKSDPAIVLPRLIWLTPAADAGGKSGGPDRTIAPPRRLQTVGHDAASVPAPAEVSPQITNVAPEDTPSIPARPMGDSFVALPGAIDGQTASNSPGGGPTGGAGGEKPGVGFGDGAARGAGVTTPTLILQIKPRYTADAMRMRIQGSVWVECVVLADGTVGDTRIMRSLDAKFGLDEEAIAAAKQWRFKPGMLNGKPVPVVVSIQLDFSVR